MYTRGVRLRLALALVIVVFNARPLMRNARPRNLLGRPEDLSNAFQDVPLRLLNVPFGSESFPRFPLRFPGKTMVRLSMKFPYDEKIDFGCCRRPARQSDESRAALESARELWQSIPAILIFRLPGA